MKMCCDCKNLEDDKASPGRSTGCLYYCKKHKKNVSAIGEKCDKFESGKRSDSKKKEICRESKLYDDSPMSAMFLFVLLGLLIILGLFMGVFQ